MKNDFTKNSIAKGGAAKPGKNIFARAKSAVKSAIYALDVKFYGLTHSRNQHKSRSASARKRGEILFLTAILAMPIGLFFLGYVYVNISSIFLSFQHYEPSTGAYSWAGMANIKRVINDLISDPLISKVTTRSLYSYAMVTLISFPLNIIFAFVVYKKVPLGKVFQVVLFLPSILSGLVISLMFKQFVDYVVPEVFRALGNKNPPNLLFDFDTAFGMQIFFVIWTGFGTQLILYAGAMSRIPDSLIEAGQLDGMTVFKEFWHITIPMIYQTIVIFLVTGVAGIFSSQLALFSFYGTNAPTELHTLGYYFFTRVVGVQSSISEYPYAAAGGLIFTLIAAPVTLLVRHLLEKFGPSAEF